MKTLILLSLVLAIVFISKAQNVNIPDANFKSALIEAGVDTDKDDEISYEEAESVTSLDVSGEWICVGDTCWIAGIDSLGGIEAFVNLDTLYCSWNELTRLDVSKNAALKYLDCGGNQLTSLDLSNNTDLTYLRCWENKLISLDVSNNTALKYLYCLHNFQLTSLDVSGCDALTILSCHWTQLTSLDISNKTSLTELDCGGTRLNSLNISGCTSLTILACWANQLATVDISSNEALTFIDLGSMPTLYEVCVWEGFDINSIDINTSGSPNVNFTTDCSVMTLNALKENNIIDIYPNPANDIVNIEIENPDNATIEIYNVSGRLVFSRKLNSGAGKIDISGLLEGMYFVKVSNGNNVSIEKLIVY